MKKLSIIVPVYNTENYISDCLITLVNQNLDNVEIICINDGSTDNSRKRIEELQKKYPQILLFNQKNYGLSVARNNGIALANGEFLLFVDSDDFLESNILKDLYITAKTLNLEILDFKVYSFKNGQKVAWREEYLHLKEPISGREYFDSFVKNYKNQPFVSACAHLFHSDFIKRNHLIFEENRYFEDLPFTAEAYFLAKKVYFLNKFVYNYRWNPDSITKTKVSRKKVEDILFITKKYEDLSNKYKVIIPMDHLFSTLRAQYKELCCERNNKEFEEIIKTNVFRKHKYFLFQFRNKLFYNLFRFHMFFLLFKVYFKTKKN